MEYLVFARKQYAEPLELTDTVQIDGDASLDQVPGGGDGWLELVLVPTAEITWVLRDGELVVDEEESP